MQRNRSDKQTGTLPPQSLNHQINGNGEATEKEIESEGKKGDSDTL